MNNTAPVSNVPLYVTDFSSCRPQTALSRDPKPNHWTLTPYETDEVTGILLGAGSLAQAPPVTLSLDVTGWHAVYLGIWDPIYAYDGPTLLKLKLTGDAAFHRISTTSCRRPHDAEPWREWQSNVLLECFWRSEDLTGKDLIIAQQTKPAQLPAYLTYVKLVPLTDPQIQTITSDRQQKTTHSVVVTNDGGSYYMSNLCETAEDLLEQVEFLRHSDVGKFIYALSHGDIANYAGDVAPSWASHMKADDVTVSTNKRQLLQTFEALDHRRLDHVQVLLDHVKGMGIEFHAMARLGALGDLPPSQLWPDGIVRNHPELRMRARDGAYLEKASYAFPQVRQNVAALIEEMLQKYDLDGINLCFSRGPQFVGYEEPVAQEFKRRHGIDLHDVPEDDRRLQQLKADCITEFVRTVRRIVGQAQEKKQKTLELSAWVCGDANDADYQLFFNIDIRTWLAEKLVDAIIAHRALGELLHEFRAADCKFYLYDDTAVAHDSLDAYEQGRSHGFVKWDLNVEDLQAWNLTRRLGHVDEARHLLDNPPLMRRIPLKTVGGYDVKSLCNIGAEKRGYWPPELLPVYTGG